MVSPQRQLWISIWNFRDVGLFKYVVISQKNCSISTRSFIHLNQKKSGWWVFEVVANASWPGRNQKNKSERPIEHT